VLSRPYLPCHPKRCLLDTVPKHHRTWSRHSSPSLLFLLRLQLRHVLRRPMPALYLLHHRRLDLVYLARLRGLQNLAGRLHARQWRAEVCCYCCPGLTHVKRNLCYVWTFLNKLLKAISFSTLTVSKAISFSTLLPFLSFTYKRMARP